MASIFIGGSREVTSLSPEVRVRLDSIVRAEYTVLVGDANGADRAVQKYLHDLGYLIVVVYHSGQVCRNNLGHWATRSIAAPQRQKGFAFYAAKDVAMAAAADFGFMLWNGRSVGTLHNILNLLSHQKSTLVYFVPHEQTYAVATPQALRRLLQACNPRDLETFERKLGLSSRLAQPSVEASSSEQLTLTSI
jgi:hypothetical protein